MPAPATPRSAKSPATKSAKAARERMSCAQAMAALEQAGTEQTRKTYLRHGASEPLFGVSFATLKALTKAIGVDHELACALWDTGNFDARNLALKVADPVQMSPADLNHWARSGAPRTCTQYVAELASEGPHGWHCADVWLAAADAEERASGWSALGALAMRDEAAPDSVFLDRLAEIETRVHSAPNVERGPLNQALIAIGCRNEALRQAALAAARRIGLVQIDHGDTACKTPDAAAAIEKAWAHSLSKGHVSPAAHERTREPLRLRC